MKKIFISYASEDKNKLKVLLDTINKQNIFEPVIVENKNHPGVPLSKKVENGIKESDFFLPILTRSSITNQWVNQEIGYAKSLNRHIIPIVEKKLCLN